MPFLSLSEPLWHSVPLITDNRPWLARAEWRFVQRGASVSQEARVPLFQPRRGGLTLGREPFRSKM